MAFIPQSGSVVAFQSNPSVLQVLATVTNPVTVSSISGTIGASIIGLPPVNVTNFPANQSVSGTLTVNNGSVVAFQGGTQITSISGTVVVQSIVGTYSEDSGHVSGNPGVFVLGVRNDTMASVQSADGDYSFHAVGPVGEMLVANAPITKWINGVASCFTGVIQPVIAAQGASIFTYITSYQIVNASANNAYLTLYGATNSIIGYAVSPASGGSNVLIPNALKSNANGAISASLSGVASVFLTMEGFISST